MKTRPVRSAKGSRALANSVKLVLFALAIAMPSFAQTIRAWAESNVVEVGTPFRVFAEANGPSAPSTVDVGAPKTMAVLGKSFGPTQMVSIVNGSVTQTSGLNGSWTLQASKQGTFTFAPSAVFAGAKVSAKHLTISVVAKGQAPQQRPHDPFGQGNPFGSFFDDPFDDFFRRPQLQQQLPTVDPAYAMEAPRGRNLFLHASVDKRVAIVGEQVTLTVLLYIDPEDPATSVTDIHEAGAPDFVRHSLRDDDSKVTPIGVANVGGRLWEVRLLRKVALFPQRTGDLSIGPMHVSLQGVRGDAARESEKFTIRVQEAPSLGRPRDYAMGNVGEYKITADVAPRDLKRDEVAVVTVRVEAAGRLPANLSPPEQERVEWLPPETKENVTIAGGKLRGDRTYTYLVKPKAGGRFSLGAFELPYYSLEKKSYQTARAELGELNVTGAATKVNETHSDDPLATMFAPATQIAPFVQSARIADRPWFWPVTFSLPFAYVFQTLYSRLRDRWRRRQEDLLRSPEYELQKRMEEALKSLERRDFRELDATSVRVLEQAILAYTREPVRALSRTDLETRLAARGLQQANRMATLLTEAEEARFSPSEAAELDAKQRWDEVRAMVTELKAFSKKGGG
ncbi:MAG: BatD family protein [Polyangiaceae bacterium]|nr:BatD family protein [Polyangiaceae bacterium]